MASIDSLPVALSPSLSDRDAIADAVYRCVLGLDTNNSALFDSAFTPDAALSVNGRLSEGLEAIHKDCFDIIAKIDTTHFITNVRINIADGGLNASMTASALAQHYRGGKGKEPNQPRLLSGGLYFVELVKETDGLWRIRDWKVVSTWLEGERGVLSGN